jgi:hypothetical protein
VPGGGARLFVSARDGALAAGAVRFQDDRPIVPD